MTRYEQPDNSNDADLVHRAQSGDSSALTELVTRYQDRVYNTCYRMCRNHADAEDLTQTTFVRAFEALPRFEIRATFFTWLYRIAVNLALSHRRTQRRPLLRFHDSREEGRPISEPAAAIVDGPEQEAERRELRIQLEEALAQIDAEYRAAVILRDVEGLDYAAIAEILEIPPGTVKSRIFRGRMMLRELLEQKDCRLDAG